MNLYTTGGLWESTSRCCFLSRGRVHHLLSYRTLLVLDYTRYMINMYSEYLNRFVNTGEAKTYSILVLHFLHSGDNV